MPDSLPHVDSLRELLQPAGRYPDLLRDESQFTGRAEAVCFPRDAEEIAAVLRGCAGRRITVQGARTGITGGAVPAGGVALNLSRMDRILGLRLGPAGTPLLRVQPGLTLSALRRWLLAPAAPPGTPEEMWRAFGRRRWRFTPDPTETSASVGGLVACNASGACSFLHGPTRRWIESLAVILADGAKISLSREQGPFAEGRDFAIPVTEGERGRVLAGTLPAWMPPAVKHAAGYWTPANQAMIDLLIGSEGTLGIAAEIELRLAPAPAHIWGLHLMVPDEASALALVADLRGQAGPQRTGLGAPLAAIEYFDAAALALLRREAAAGGVARYPVPPGASGCAVYLELEADDAEALRTAAAAIRRAFAAAGGRVDRAWVASGPADLDRLKALRHVVPEAVNQIIAARRRDHPGLTKVGTDLAVPDARLPDVMALYREGLSKTGLAGVIFGHIGDNHLHVNILPRNLDEGRRAKALYAEWAARCVVWGGTVSAEHGIGKLKTALLEILCGRNGIAAMRRIKSVFDPDGRLNAGTLFADDAG